MKITWLALEGHAVITESEIIFSPPAPDKPKKSETKTPPFAQLRSNLYFESGDIFAEVLLKGSDTKLQFKFKSHNDATIFVGFNVRTSAYGIAQMQQENISELALSGLGLKPEVDKWINLHIKIRGSSIDLFIDGISVASAQAPVVRSQLAFVASGTSGATVRNINVKQKRPIVFVVMQFSKEYDALYNDVISPICDSYGYDVLRADDVYNSGLIINDIITLIKNSSLVIADITPNNPNVYYELGYAHGIGKQTILLSDKSRDKLPFDISPFRLLFYDNTIAGKVAVEAALKKHLDAIQA